MITILKKKENRRTNRKREREVKKKNEKGADCYYGQWVCPAI